MQTIKEAKRKGCKIQRMCIYYAITPNGMCINLPFEARYEYLYQWRKYPKKRKKKS